MASVSVAKYLENDVAALKYAKILSNALNEISIDGRIGKFAGFERSAVAQLSGIRKVHIRMPNDEPWKKGFPQRMRSSDNFLIYCQHHLISDCYLLIAIISPDAHAKSDKMITNLAEYAESNFHCLNESQIQELTSV